MTPTVLTIIQLVTVLLLAPFAFGLIRFVKAHLVGRRGMSPFMPYVALATYLKKENLISTSASWVFRLGPYVSLACSIFLAASLPLLGVGGVFSAFSHFLIFIGVLNIATAFVVLGAIDAGSVFGSMGASRQMLVTSLTLPTFVLVFVSYAIVSRETTIDGMLANNISILAHPFLFLPILALILTSLAENDRYPVDNPETSLELTMIREAVSLNYSGPYLALMEYAGMVKLVVFELLIMNLLFPLPLLEAHEGVGDVVVVILVVIAKVFLSALVIGILETVVAKMKFYRLHEYLTTAFFLSLAGVGLVLVSANV